MCQPFQLLLFKRSFESVLKWLLLTFWKCLKNQIFQLHPFIWTSFCSGAGSLRGGSSVLGRLRRGRPGPAGDGTTVGPGALTWYWEHSWQRLCGSSVVASTGHPNSNKPTTTIAKKKAQGGWTTGTPHSFRMIFVTAEVVKSGYFQLRQTPGVWLGSSG